MTQYDFEIEDLKSKIQATDIQYDILNNAVLMFSGGKDSAVASKSLDLALPNNKIPRLFINTGIEYSDIVKYVKEMAKIDDRIIIVNSGVNIPKMLNEYGYPFKSKAHSHNINIYQNNKEETNVLLRKCKENEDLLKSYDFIENLPNGTKSVVSYMYGLRKIKESKTIGESKKKCPKKLQYQFTNDFTLKCSDKCCDKLKKEVAGKWQIENNKNIVITGMRKAEGGSRDKITCVVIDKKDSTKIKKFHPLAIRTNDFIEQMIEKENIEICKLYYPPYNFRRTGCKGCGFALDLQEQLDVMEKYLPNELKQCEMIWKPVYEEYRRIGYRLKKYKQLSLFDN